MNRIIFGRRLRRFVVVVALAMTIPGGPVGAASAVQSVLLGTATEGGGFEIYGRALSEVVAESDPGLAILLRATSGSMQNVPLLRSGTLDIALVQGTAVEEALAGGQSGKNPLSILYAMYPSPGMFVVRADQPYRTIDDLRGRRVAFGATGSGLVGLARDVLDGLGWDMHRDFDVLMLERAGDGPGLVARGEAAALWGAGAGWPGFEAVAHDAAGGRFIGLSDAEIASVTAKYPYLKEMVVPAGAYPGLMEPVKTVGPWSFILARPGLPDALAYRLVRALHLAEAKLAARLPAAGDSTAANTVVVADPGALHPGAARYFREIGLLP